MGGCVVLLSGIVLVGVLANYLHIDRICTPFHLLYLYAITLVISVYTIIYPSTIFVFHYLPTIPIYTILCPSTISVCHSLSIYYICTPFSINYTCIHHFTPSARHYTRYICIFHTPYLHIPFHPICMPLSIHHTLTASPPAHHSTSAYPPIYPPLPLQLHRTPC